jgi:hypothetical protein
MSARSAVNQVNEEDVLSSARVGTASTVRDGALDLKGRVESRAYGMKRHLPLDDESGPRISYPLADAG